MKGGQWEEMLVSRGAKKDVRVRLRLGNAAQEILAEARDEESDLIVLGCTQGAQCIWQVSAPVPQKVVNDAGCSVLLVKEEQPITKIMACLDQTHVSQSSLEIVNQMVTIHGAQLEVIGLNPEAGLKKEAGRGKMDGKKQAPARPALVRQKAAEILSQAGGNGKGKAKPTAGRPKPPWPSRFPCIRPLKPT